MGLTQRGSALVELMVAILIASILSVYATNKILNETADAAAASAGSYISQAAAGVQRYALTNFNALANGQAIAGVANTVQPTFAELQALGRIPVSVRATGPLNATLRFDVTRTGCPGAACVITAMTCTTGPIQYRGRFRDDLATNAVMAMNGTGGRSMLGNGGVISGAAFVAPNPLGNVEGVVCGQSAVDAGAFATFVQLNDNRDPNFQGPVTAVGQIRSATGVGAAAVGAPCLRTQLTPTGQVQTFAADCTMRAQVDGNTGNVTSLDIAGTTRASLGFNGAATEVMADALRNAASTGGVRSDGTLFGVSAIINTTSAPGNACTNANEAVWGLVGTTRLLLSCQGGTYQVVGGTQTGAVGGACATEGAPGITAAGVSLLCSNGFWSAMFDRLGHWAMLANYSVVNGSVVPKPACQIGAIPRIFSYPQAVDSSNLYTNFETQDTGASWTVAITDGAGTALGGSAFVQVGCWY